MIIVTGGGATLCAPGPGLVKRLRQAWPKVRIVFRGDSGFCRWRMLS